MSAKSPKRNQLYVEPRMPPRWDLAIIFLTIASLAVVFFEEVSTLSPGWQSLLHWGDTAICLIFVGDFTWRLKMAPRRMEFFRRNWVDLVGSIPMIDALRGVRLVRLVRLLRLTRFVVISRRLRRRFDVRMPTGALGGIAVLTISMWLLSSLLFFRFEEGHNEAVTSFSDALWWGMTTLSTVGYGDLYPRTQGGRVVAVGTMVLGIGLLGAVAATVATVFVEFKDRGKRGLRRYVLRDHLLVLGWNQKAEHAVVNFLADPRHDATQVVVVANLEMAPMDDPRVRFVRGAPGKVSVLRKASAERAGAAIVLARDPSDPRSDHENTMIVTALRRLNDTARIGVELVDSDNHEHLVYAGCDAVIDKESTVANLLVRGVQDMGVSDVVMELLSSEVGSELYRARIATEFVGGQYRDYAIKMLDEAKSVIGLARLQGNLLNPDPDTLIQATDDAFVVAREPPR